MKQRAKVFFYVSSAVVLTLFVIVLVRIHC
jgi:hypothetical protein